jgi:ABC-type glycerol-3-phosphate transport system substrate-binding protein
MKLLATAALAAILLVSACGGTKDTAAPETSPKNAADALAALLSERFERNLEMNPLSATLPLSTLESKIDRWIETQL